MICNICNKEFDTIKELTKHLITEHKYNAEQIYSLNNYSFETGEAICPICGKEFTMTKRQMKEFKDNPKKAIGCSKKCSVLLARMITGSPFNNPEVRAKAKRTILERYGTEYATQSTKVKEKTKKTNLEKYGTEYATQSNKVKEKTKKTNLEKYGVEHPAQVKEFQDKAKQTNLEKYGVEHPAQSKEVLEKMKKTTFERYGVENASQAEEIKEKKKQTCLEHFGVMYPAQSPEVMKKVQEKLEQTNLERYGVKRPTQSPEVLERMGQTNLEKYGNMFPISSEQFQEKAKQTNIEKYGVDNVFKSAEFREKAQQTNIKKYGVRFASQAEEVKEAIKQANLEKYGVEYFCQHERCLKANGNRISKLNKRFQEFLSENNIESELEFIIDNSGYDLKVNSTLIELDPYFTHNTTIGPCFSNHRRKPILEDYHLTKTNKAKEEGYNCIHVFDWDDWNKVVMILQDRVKIAARKCEVKEVGKKEAKEFLENYHLQGSTKSIQYAFGLFQEDKLMQVMTFGKPRYNKNYEYELLRLCTIPGVTIIGGAAKILKYFEEQIKPTSIISYCDLSKFNGDIYTKLGFELQDKTAPAKHWYNFRTKRHITDNLLRQRGFDQLHNTDFGKGTSNEQLMLDHGYVEIYDCGQLVFKKTI